MEMNDLGIVKSIHDILRDVDYQPKGLSRPKNVIDIFDFDGDVSEFAKLGAILSGNDEKEPLEGRFKVLLGEFIVPINIKRENNFMTIALRNTPTSYQFALNLKDEFRFLYWDENSKQCSYRAHCGRFLQRNGQIVFQLLWEKAKEEGKRKSRRDLPKTERNITIAEESLFEKHLFHDTLVALSQPEDLLAYTGSMGREAGGKYENHIELEGKDGGTLMIEYYWNSDGIAVTFKHINSPYPGRLIYYLEFYDLNMHSLLNRFQINRYEKNRFFQKRHISENFEPMRFRWSLSIAIFRKEL